MPPSAEPAMLVRFSRAERLVHRVSALLMGVCLVTAAILYNSQLAIPIGHRHLVETVHVYAGLALPVPLLAALVSVAYRADLRRLNRFTPADWRWFRSSARRDGQLPVGKFNAGQKLNAALSAGSILVLFGTGVLMHFTRLGRLSWRTGATFMHDWFALGLGLLVLGHIFYAIRDPQARRGMRTGSVPADWAHEEHGEWAAEMAEWGDAQH
ncbi:MAG: cytochrome b/b6 domain-containing protein [Actinomycetota bacterium]|nr:cytochrome b/b6 domain-containing protein [Actinomycetota bacterium]